MSEAELIARMHTEWASGAPDLEYTPIADKLPPVTGEVAALREQITQLHCDYSGQIATLELRVRELVDIITRKWGNPFVHMRDSAVFAALDALAAYWHIITLPLDSGGVLMRLYDPATMEKAVEFTGPLHDVVLHAAAWFDGVKFEVQP